MSEYTALREATLTLADLLRTAFAADPALQPLFAIGYVVSLRTPKEMRTMAPLEEGLSIWMYQVERNEFLNNRPFERLDFTSVRRPPLPMNLHYLMTPVTDDPAIEQAIMGKVLQVLYDGAIVPPSPARPELLDELHITLENLNLDSVSRIWTALEEPYRLSVSYLVEAVNIRSGNRPDEAAPVLHKNTSYHQIVTAP
jgi:uncharacterized protein DUF4255